MTSWVPHKAFGSYTTQQVEILIGAYRITGISFFIMLCDPASLDVVHPEPWDASSKI